MYLMYEHVLYSSVIRSIFLQKQSQISRAVCLVRQIKSFGTVSEEKKTFACKILI